MGALTVLAGVVEGRRRGRADVLVLEHLALELPGARAEVGRGVEVEAVRAVLKRLVAFADHEEERGRGLEDDVCAAGVDARAGRVRPGRAGHDDARLRRRLRAAGGGGRGQQQRAKRAQRLDESHVLVCCQSASTAGSVGGDRPPSGYSRGRRQCEAVLVVSVVVPPRGAVRQHPLSSLQSTKLSSCFVSCAGRSRSPSLWPRSL